MKRFIFKKLLQLCDYLIKKYNVDEEDILRRINKLKEGKE